MVQLLLVQPAGAEEVACIGWPSSRLFVRRWKMAECGRLGRLATRRKKNEVGDSIDSLVPKEDEVPFF